MSENHAAAPSGGKIWTAGTLTYSTAGIVVLFIWLLGGDLAWSMKERAVGFVAGLLAKSYGLSDLMYSLLIISFPNFTNIFLMPIVSYRSDRHRGRFGRRIPYLLMYTPLVVLGLVGLGLTPWLGYELRQVVGEAHLSANMAGLIIFAVSWIILDLGTTMTNALFMALSNDVVPRALIGRFVAMFRAVSLGCAVVFNKFVLRFAETHVMVIFLSLAALYGIGLAVMCLKVKEGEYPPPPPVESSGGAVASLKNAVKTYFRECFALPYYRWVIGAYVVCVMSVLPINSYVIFHVKSLNISLATFGNIQAGVFLFAMVVSYLLGSLADRFHPLRCGIVSMALLSVILLIGGFIIKDTFTFSLAYIGQSVVIMSFNTLVASYGQRLFPKALYAQFNSALLMIQSFATVLLAPVVGSILDFAADRFYPGQPGAQYYLIFSIGGIIGCIGVAMMCVVFRYYIRLGGDENYRAPLDLEKDAE